MGTRSALIAVVVLLAGGLGLWFVLNGGQEPGPGDGEVATAAPGGASAEDDAAARLEDPGGVAETPRPDRVAVEEDAAALATPATADAGAAAAAAGPALHGRVVDRMGNPIPGAQVFASTRDGFPLDVVASGSLPDWVQRWVTRSGDDGTFTLEGPGAGELRMLVRAPGYAPWRDDEVLVADGASFRLEDVVLDLGVSLAGRVVDADGIGVRGAELRLLGDERGMHFFTPGMRSAPAATTDGNGAFRIDVLAPGAWRLLVESEEHPDGRFEGLAERPGMLADGLELRLERGDLVAGRVTNVPDDQRGQLEVRAVPREDPGFFEMGLGSRGVRTAEVEEDGSFVIQGLKLDQEVLLQARSKPQGGFGFFSGRTRSDQVAARPGDRGVVLPFKPEAGVSFRVVDGRTGAALEEFEVDAGLRWPEPLMGPDGRRLTEHPDGRARVGNLRPGGNHDTLTLRIRTVGYAEYERDDLRIVAGQELDLGEIRLEPIPILQVTVLDDRTGDPIENARVSLRKETPRPAGGAFSRQVVIEVDDEDGGFSFPGDGRNARTDADGVARLSSYGGETCTLAVEHDDFARRTLTGLELPAGEPAAQVVRLNPGGRVVATVLDEAGVPVAGVKVEHRAPGAAAGAMGFRGLGHRSPENVTDVDGQVVFAHLEAGTHSFRLDQGPSGSRAMGRGMVFMVDGASRTDESWTDVEVAEGATQEVTLVKETLSTLTGRITESGMDLVGASLSLAEKREGGDRRQMAFMGGGGVDARTDGRGEYTFEDVKSGEYTLTIRHPKRSMAVERDVLVKDGTNRFDVDLPVSILEGRITDSEGNPVPGLDVSAARARGDDGPRTVMVAFTAVNGEESGMVSTGEDLGDTVRTDEDGRYTLRGVLADVELVVRARGGGIQPARSEPVTVAANAVVTGVDFEVLAGGTIRVDVAEADGSAPQFVLIEAEYEDELEDGQGGPGTDSKVEFAQGGKATLTGLRPGRWRVSIRRPGFGGGGDPGAEPDPQVVDVEGGETAVAEFVLP